MHRVLAFTDGGYTALVGPAFPGRAAALAMAESMEERVFNSALSLGVDPTVQGISYSVVEAGFSPKHDYSLVGGFVQDQLRDDCTRNYGLRAVAMA